MSLSNLPHEQRALIEACELRLEYSFQDSSLLLEALTHASNANTRLRSNERLEFLGDSILGFVVCDLLYQRYPDLLEGDLTQIKSAAVSRSTCGKVGNRMAQFSCSCARALGINFVCWERGNGQASRVNGRKESV